MLLCEWYDALKHYEQVHPPESAGELWPGSAGDALPLRASVCTDICGTGKCLLSEKEKKKKATSVAFSIHKKHTVTLIYFGVAK